MVKSYYKQAYCSVLWLPCFAHSNTGCLQHPKARCTRHPCTCSYCSRLVLLEVRWLGRWAFLRHQVGAKHCTREAQMGTTDHNVCVLPFLISPVFPTLGFASETNSSPVPVQFRLLITQKSTWIDFSEVSSHVLHTIDLLRPPLPFAMVANTVTNGMPADTALWADAPGLFFLSC